MRLSEGEAFRRALGRIAETAGREIDLQGSATAAQACLAAALAVGAKCPVVVVCDGLKRQEQVQQDLETWLSTAGGSRPLFFPAWEVLPHDSKLPHVDVISERLETLETLLRGDAEGEERRQRVITTTATALMQRTFASGELRARTRVLRRGESLAPLDFIEWLEDQGYEPEVQVSQRGEVALRGGIIDVFPPTHARPLRIEFFGNEIDSLRHFDPLTQISEDTVETAQITPAGELGILRRKLRDSAGTAGGVAHFGALEDYLPTGATFVFLDPSTILKHASEYSAQVPPGDPLFQSLKEAREGILARGHRIVRCFPDDAPKDTGKDYWSGAESAQTLEATEDVSVAWESLDPFRPIADRAPEPEVAEQQRRTFLEQILRWMRQGYEIQVFCNNDGERQRLHEIWEEEGFSRIPAEAEGTPLAAGGLGVALKSCVATLARGFLCNATRTVVVTDAEVFGRYKVARPRRLKSAHAATARSLAEVGFSDLEAGDFVVHLQHGIGKYLGLQVLPSHRAKGAPIGAGGEGQECLVIEYAPSDPEQPAPKLYVPVSEAHLVSKYIGAGKARPPLNTLSGTRWHKAKAQAEQAVKDLASELLSIQAARDSQTGFSFGEDTPWQREFESAFLYEETADQIHSIEAVKRDMQSARPMDRLICGDVGFGKTEVAIRAAFKAVMGGKQVALMAPTTVLAQQHYNTLRERMADYPVRVDLLSRFRSLKQQRQTLANLANGGVDIVVGTHRLVQSDVEFKDLGLVIVDEEQKFGVMHKERFKQFRQLVDVLTLSATPIPRTLYLALSGARDLSTIDTPPQDRLPVETVLAQYDERLIRDAIQRELNREGQVYFLHNRVSTIEAVAIKLRALLPHARILVGHGQMDADDLERVMTAFVNGEADVLLCTTIIESGLDIPNANTIIIDRADRFGLSELYQLRGRVGRYKHQAYAFLLLPRHAGLLSDARKRLSAIKQYSSLGSGFKIAMRDLELRGAGNLLGAQQSGHIAAVGFELYCQLLKQSIAVHRGEKVKPRLDVQWRVDFLRLNPEPARADPSEPAQKRAKPKDEIRIHIPREVATLIDDEEERQEAPPPVPPAYGYIPTNYVPDAKHRIEIYRKLAQCSDKAGLEQIRKESRDRFGPPPPSVEWLLAACELKLFAAERGISVIEVKEDRLMLMRNQDWVMLGGKFPRLTKRETKSRLQEMRRFISALEPSKPVR